MKKIMFIIMSIVMTMTMTDLFSTTSYAATDYYVSTTGSDSNNGSQSSPFATIKKASLVAQAGDTVHVASGTYFGCLTTKASGTSTAHIRYVSDTKWGAKLVTPSYDTCQYVWMNQGSYVDIDGFEVFSLNVVTRYGIFNSGGSYVRIMNNHIHDINPPDTPYGGAGIVTDGPNYANTNVDMIGNVVNDISYNVPGQRIQGIYHTTNGIIQNNIVYRVQGYCIQLWHAPYSNIVTNNTVFNCQTGGIVVGAGDAPYNYDPAHPADYITVSNNIIRDSGFSIIEAGITGTHNVYSNNLVYGNNKDITLQNGLVATNTVTSDPQFISYNVNGGGNYHLLSTSPAVNAGTSTGAPSIDLDGFARPRDVGYDIGAYEGMFVYNGGFEVGSPDGFTPYNWVGSSTFTWDSSVKHTGSRSVKIANTLSTTQGGYIMDSSKYVPVMPNKSYSITAWVNTTSFQTGSNAFLDIVQYNSSGGVVLETQSSSITTNSGWTMITYSLTTASTTANIRIDGRLYGIGNAWFDDLNILDNSTLTPSFTPPSSPSAPNPNLISNSGFEVDNDGDGVPEDWTPYNWVGSSTFSRDSTNMYNRYWSAKIVNPLSTTQGGWLMNSNRYMDVSPSSAYSFSARVNTSGFQAGSQVFLDVIQYDSSNNIVLETQSSMITSNSVWAPINYSLTTASSTAKIRVDCRFYGIGTVQFDDIEMTGATPNLVFNPGFETGSPSGWTNYNWAGTSTFTWDSSVNYAGSRSVKIANTLSTNQGGWVTTSDKYFDIKPNRNYLLTARVNTSSFPAGSKAFLEMIQYDSTNTLISETVTSNITSNTSWQEIVNGIITAPNATKMRVDVRLYGSGNAWFDEVSIK